MPHNNYEFARPWRRTDHAKQAALCSELRPWPDVSIVVPVYNDHSRLRKCISALLDQAYAGSLEIIVVDNGSDERLDLLAHEFPTVVFLREERIGSYHARNAGIAHASGAIFAFTDADCIPDKHWVYYGITSLCRDEKCAFVGGKIEMFLANKHAASASELYSYVIGFHQNLSVNWRKYSATANLFVRREVLLKGGLFNGEFRAGGDVEWGNRVSRAYGRPKYEARAVVRHPAGISQETAGSQADIYRTTRRTMAGARDRAPSWGGCCVTVFKQIIAPILDTWALFGKNGRTLSPLQWFAVFGFSWRIRIFGAFERLRLQLKGGESPRS